MSFPDRALILALSGALASTSIACSRMEALLPSEKSTQSGATSATPSPAVSPTPAATPANPSSPTLSPEQAYQRALDTGYSAASLSQSALTADDWQLVVNRWQEAIALLESIPAESSDRATAQAKIAEYQRNLNVARQKAANAGSGTVSSTGTRNGETVVVIPGSNTTSQEAEAPSETAAANPDVIKVPIKRRVGQTPAIEVTFNGEQTFEMVLDTGASGTVITQEMADSLGVVPSGEVTADTASERGVRFAVGEVQSIAVGGATIQDVPVAIGGPDLEIGLLGQDFHGNYDIVIRQDAIEFHSRSRSG